MADHAELIRSFYEAFGRRDHEAMAACYHPDVHFSDPVFPDLVGDEARAMWHMLCDQGQDLVVRASDITADGDTGSAHWEATYTFTPTGRKVHNRIDASFEFSDGLIIRHVDSFDLWKWLRMAVGWSGSVVGWTSSARAKVRQTGADGLRRFMEDHPEYRSPGAT
jgi:ketosteroid isomerase-like protein